MKYTYTTAEKSTIKLVINFDGAEWADAQNKAYLKARGKFTVHGFRKGKAPKAVIENYYGKDVFFDDALNLLYADGYPEVLEKEKDNFEVVGDPTDLSVDELKDDVITISAVVPVKPELKLEKYTGLEMKKYEYNVQEEDVNAEVKKILVKNAEKVEVTDRPCANEDTVNINFKGSVNGEVKDGMVADNYDLVLGSGSFIPGFEEQVVGMNVGEEKAINVTFPEDYHAEELAGKPAVFEVKVNSISAQKLPELTDEYVAKNTAEKTVEAYTAKVKERLERDAERRSIDETENSILQEICKYATCEIPDAMINAEIDVIMNDIRYKVMNYGVSLEDYVKMFTGKSMEEFRADYKAPAENRVLTKLIIEYIIKNENIVCEDAELDEKIAEQAKSLGKAPKTYKKSMDPRQIEYLKNDVIITKLFNFLKENNTLTV